MTRAQRDELDSFYVRQIAYWLQRSEDAEREIRFWEIKRKELRNEF